MFEFKVGDLTVEILDSSPPSTPEEDFARLVEYVAVLEEIDNNLKKFS